MLLEALDQHIRTTVRSALAEDLGTGDLTALLVPETIHAKARVISRETGVLCGSAWFNGVFHELDDSIKTHWTIHDGDGIQPDQLLCTVSGPARSLLTGERTALNFLQTLSGTAPLARRY